MMFPIGSAAQPPLLKQYIALCVIAEGWMLIVIQCLQVDTKIHWVHEKSCIGRGEAEARCCTNVSI